MIFILSRKLLHNLQAEWRHMKSKQYQAVIEGILFTMGESVEITRLAEALELETEQVRQILHKMMEGYQIGRAHV